MNATVNVCSEVTEVRADHVWTDADGETHGSLDLGAPWIVFHDPAQARQVAAALTGLADAMEAEAGRHAVTGRPEGDGR